jgi:hypothetical protein
MHVQASVKALITGSITKWPPNSTSLLRGLGEGTDTVTLWNAHMLFAPITSCARDSAFYSKNFLFYIYTRVLVLIVRLQASGFRLQGWAYSTYV